MSTLERIAEFLKFRDESVLPDERDDAERMESAREILRLLVGPEGKLDLADLLMTDSQELTLQLMPAPRPAGVCRACGSTRTLRGRPLTGLYCSPQCREAGPSRPKVDLAIEALRQERAFNPSSKHRSGNSLAGACRKKPA